LPEQQLEEYMMKSWLAVLILSSCCWAQIHIGGHSLNLPKRKAPKGGSPEVQLQGTTAGTQASPVDDSTTQTLTFALQNIDDSQGVNVHVQNGCTSIQPAQKISAGVYKVIVSVDDTLIAGNCGITFESIATKDAGTFYLYFKAGDLNKIAPDFVKFRQAKSFTFKFDDGEVLETKVTQATDKGNDATTLVLSGGPPPLMIAAAEYPNKFGTAFKQCVLKGTLKDGIATLVVTNPSPFCKIKSATVTAGD
jgi:hypothetical protein